MGAEKREGGKGGRRIWPAYTHSLLPHPPSSSPSQATTSSNSLVSSTGTPSSLSSPDKKKRSDGYTLALLAAIIGNVLEFYDFR